VRERYQGGHWATTRVKFPASRTTLLHITPKNEAEASEALHLPKALVMSTLACQLLAKRAKHRACHLDEKNPKSSTCGSDPKSAKSLTTATQFKKDTAPTR
jgi:hypothetical protein